ncbi:uncharacterized protein BBOV_IV005650 [Babesia bovis T2Bo]|uniref:Membrane protein, putative n=1 Tax=Babesia bovis TaxID=5865 RepID=A7AQV7_BABBO|nr:uncharacterized protein BBOV_IV005650 [Babesia bovis T2Bo]EDO06926.1 hypothetical protein BBOV_IV005650 [Babesia bovis T2Bo]BAN65460.1 membrane protein, putative [Babesia bovis]|eukprot:XP_001610494.1 hypothetical protein [Babesia bovis T2Bo]
MNVAVAVALLAYTQVKSIVAQMATKVDYEGVIPTTEERVKLVMSLMDSDGNLDEDLVDLIREKYRKHCVEMFKTASSDTEEEGDKVNSIYRSRVDINNMCSIDSDLFIGYLNVVGYALDELFTGLYGENYHKLVEGYLEAGIRESGLEPKEFKFLNTRFVFPVFYDDIRELYSALEPEGPESSSSEDEKEPLDIMYKWVDIQTNGLVPAEHIDEQKVSNALAVLFSADKTPFSQIVVHILVYNLFSEDTEKAREEVIRCSRLLNEASCETI